MSLDENVRTMLRERAESVAATPVVPERTMRRVRMKKAQFAGALVVVAAIGVAGAFVVRSAFSTDAAPLRPAGEPNAAETTDAPSSAATPQAIEPLGDFAPLEAGTSYYMDPDKDPSTPLRVVYTIPADGWSEWLGTVKFADDEGHVAVSTVTVTNVATHGCRDHSPAHPPVGPTVDDLATALADLAPFRLTSPPTDITKYGYRGKHLELTVPDLPVEGAGDNGEFANCVGGNLNSWFSPYDPEDGFYGHGNPGYVEEFWILDVEGSRLVIVAHRSANSPANDVAELHAVLDSIQIEP